LPSKTHAAQPAGGHLVAADGGVQLAVRQLQRLAPRVGRQGRVLRLRGQEGAQALQLLAALRGDEELARARQARRVQGLQLQVQHPAVRLQAEAHLAQADDLLLSERHLQAVPVRGDDAQVAAEGEGGGEEQREEGRSHVRNVKMERVSVKGPNSRLGLPSHFLDFSDEKCYTD
jgi:hypothetical protein